MVQDILHQVTTQLMQISAIPFLAAFLGGLFVYQIRNRRAMLAAKATVDGAYALYFWLMHAPSGACGCLIALLGGFVQVFTPDRHMQKTLLYRNVIAAVLALAGMWFVAQRTTDFLPLIAAAAARFVETQQRPQRIRIGMSVILTLWIFYAAESGLYLMLIAFTTVFLSVVLAIYRHRKISMGGE